VFLFSVCLRPMSCVSNVGSVSGLSFLDCPLCKLQKGALDSQPQVIKLTSCLPAHGRWFSLASSTTKTGRHDIAEILLKVALNTINLI
jgi:hypothetical protein